MSAGADGAGWGVSAATSVIGPKARWCQVSSLKGAERPERGETDHAWVLSPHSQVLRRGSIRRKTEGLPNRDKNAGRGVWFGHILKLQKAGPHTLFS
jgi:hypothetical protein